MMSSPLAQVAMAFTAFAVSAGATRWLATHGAQRGPIDIPNARSLHATPVPRTGGLAVLLGLAVPWLVLVAFGAGVSELPWIVLALIPIAGIAYLDDLGHVARRWRLLAQCGAAVLLMAGGLLWSTLVVPGWTWGLPLALAIPLTLLHCVWMINLYNFMDGMDGLAGGMAVFGFGALAILGWSGGETGYALTALAVAAAAGGFLTTNFPPARIFLGDTGSSSLGLLAAALSLWGAGLDLFPLWVAWLAFSPFILDATWTLVARASRREPIWEPHRSHHFQRLVLAGWSHRKTALRAYGVMAAAAACAVAAPRLPAHEQWLLLGGWAAIYVLIHLKVSLIERGATATGA